MNKIIWAFFGTSKISVIVLEELKKRGFLPSFIVTTEDKPKGRKMIITPPEVKVWAEKEGIPYIQPKSLKNEEVEKEIRSKIPECDLFIVVSYGKIIPQNILDIPKHQTLNVHPSLLPKLRGPSPIQSAILLENETGVSIMRIDSEMDHGPIISQRKIDIDWPPYEEDLEKISGQIGGEELAKIIPEWIDGKIEEKEQDHNSATYCKKIEKQDGEINFEEPSEKNLRKIRAFHIWPGAFFFYQKGDKKIRIIVKKAHLENGELVLETVIPEGKKEMSYKDFLNGEKSKN